MRGSRDHPAKSSAAARAARRGNPHHDDVADGQPVLLQLLLDLGEDRAGLHLGVAEPLDRAGRRVRFDRIGDGPADVDEPAPGGDLGGRGNRRSVRADALDRLSGRSRSHQDRGSRNASQHQLAPFAVQLVEPC